MASTATTRKRGAASAARSSAAADLDGPDFLFKRIAWLALAAAWVFIVISLAGFHPGDPPTTSVFPSNSPTLNPCGDFGAILAYHGYQMLGWGAWALVALWALYLAATALGRRVTHPAVRLIGVVLIAASVGGLQGIALPESGPVDNLGGGLVGHTAAGLLITRFNTLGSTLWLALLLAVGATVALDVWAWIAAIWTGKAVFVTARAGSRATVATAGWLSTRLAARAEARAQRKADRRARANDLDDDASVPGRAGKSRRSPLRADANGERGPADAISGRKHRRSKKKLADTGKIREDAGGIGGVEEFDPDEETVTPIAETRRSGSGLDAEVEMEECAADDVEADDGLLVAADDHGPEARATDDDHGPEAHATDDDEDDLLPGAPQVFDPDDLRAKIEKLPLRFGAKSARSATDDDLRDIQNNLDMEGYEFPQLELLEAPELNYSDEMEVFVREQAEALERALKEYRINGEVVGIDSGPVITLYEVRLAPGTKVAQVSAVSSDIARALKAVNIRIVSNMAGRDTVGVEVPNAKKEKVRLRELMADSERYRDMALPMFLGKDASGEPLIQDLAQMPHLLIAGTTGSGKSVCMNAVIMSFLYTRKPNELKLVLVDPKMVELSQFKDIPHLMCPVVTEMSKAAAILEWAVGKMEERYALLAEAGCRDISAYNALSWEDLKEAFQPESPAEEARIPRKLPYMVFIIDELADMMMTNKEVEQSIVRLAQKARAVGIHLILATQRPQANVVTGLIKSNMPARVSFKVASGMDSRIIMDQKGGELLLGQGDMLYLSPRTSKLMRAQGTLVDDKEIRRVVRFMREIASPSFERQLVSIRTKTDEEMRDGLANAQEDPLFDAAVEIVLETKRGSVSMLQRRLAIGYTRAARLVEMMGEAGIIGQHKGTVAREVSMTVEEWRALKQQAAADAAEAAAANPAEAHASGRGAQADLFDSDDVETDLAEADAAPPFAPTPDAAASDELVALADNAADAYDDEDDEDESEEDDDAEDEEYEDDEEEDDEDLDEDLDEEDVEDATGTPAKPPVQLRTDRRGVQR